MTMKIWTLKIFWKNVENFGLSIALNIHMERVKGIFSDSNNIILWHNKSEDANTKGYFQNFICQFYIYKLFMIMCIGIAPQTIVLN